MTEPDADFDDVVAALAGTALAPGPRGVDAIASALVVAPAVPERVRGLEAAIERDADEAWSLAIAFLADEEAAWQAVVGGFLALGRGDCAALSRADTLRAQAGAALEVWRLLTKAGATREVPGSALTPEVRLGLLLRAGLSERDVTLEGAPDLAAALAALHPRPGHAQGDELCRLVAGELLDALDPEQASTLAALRRSHPTSAALLRERYAEVVEVPLLVLPRQDELLTAVRAQLALEEEQRARHEALRLILEQTDLASTFRNETLMICPPEEARGELRLRIFDTRDLEAWLDPDVLEGIVTRGVGEDAWDDPAWIRNHHQQLLVHQTDEVHAAIDQVLAKLRVSRARNQAGQGR